MRLVELPRETSFDKSMVLDTSFSAKPVECADSAIEAPSSPFGTFSPPDATLLQVPQTPDHIASLHECTTYGEARDALARGIPPSRILFTDSTKSPASLRFASRLGIENVAVDDLEDLSKIKAHLPTAKIVLRINASAIPEHLCPDSSLAVALEVACDLLEEAASLKLHVTDVRLHVDSADTHPSAYLHSVKQLSALLDEVPLRDTRLPQLFKTYPELGVSLESLPSSQTLRAHHVHRPNWPRAHSSVAVH